MMRPSGVPGAPPPPRRSENSVTNFGSSSGTFDLDSDDTEEFRLLQALTRAEGPVELSVLHYASGLPASRLRMWLDVFESQGMIKRIHEGDKDFVTLRGK